MWALVWFQIVTGLGIEYFQLGSYDSYQKCNASMQTAAVMKTSVNIKIACIEFKVEPE
jgi:hypothetical protein|tara:strand:+ start:1294 stop:1467 length:174 start_codon:yes stop_codon:yes gene_type:complete